MAQLIKRKSNNNPGQVALVMVMVMTLISAVVVSIAGKVTTETRIQELNKENEDAFLAAQSGLEEALVTQQETTGNLADGKAYKVTISTNGQDGLVTDPIPVGTSFDVVLGGSDSLQGVKVYWKELTSSPSAIIVTKITPDSITDFAFNSSGLDGFTRVVNNGNLNGEEFTYVTDLIGVDPTVERLRIAVYGGQSIVGVEPVGDLLPVQSVSYNSEGQVGTGNIQVKYGLNYEESKDKKIPEVFDYALFSFGSIIQ